MQWIPSPVIIEAAGMPPKRIEEFFGRVASGASAVSIARMVSPAGWSEPAQCPEFDEYTVVLEGALEVEVSGRTVQVHAGQAIHIASGERVRYATPQGAVYIAVCLPAFSPALVHREE